MSQLDLDSIRHALSTARANGFRVVRLRQGDDEFSATVSEHALIEEEFDFDEEDLEVAPSETVVTSPVVGYLRLSDDEMVEGKSFEEGALLAEIVALGIANPVLAESPGTIKEVCATDGQAMEFGQPIFKVEAK